MTRFTSYEKNYVLGRDAKCLFCGKTENNGETLYKGQNVVRITTAKSKRFAHSKCLCKMWLETDRELTNGCNYDSQLDNHNVVIVAPKEEAPYFTECGFSVKPHNAQYRKFILNNETCGYRSGHIVKKVLENSGYKVVINGTEVKTHEDYRKILGK